MKNRDGQVGRAHEMFVAVSPQSSAVVIDERERATTTADDD